MVRAAADDNTNIIFGATVDERLAGQMWVTVVATGFLRSRGGRASRPAETALGPVRRPRRRRPRPAGLPARRLSARRPGAKRGAVAAGHELTAQAVPTRSHGGGNAVDALVAAGAMSWAAEPA